MKLPMVDGRRSIFRRRSGNAGIIAHRPAPSTQAAAFTLIEIMVVVIIVGIVMASGIPSLMSALRKEGMRKAVGELESGCQAARRLAIMSGRPADLVLRPQEGTMSVGASSASASEAPVGGEDAARQPTAAGGGGSGFAGKLPENVAFEMLDVNLREFAHEAEARVRFYPNGTCDEFVAILVSDKNERRALTLEITTGLATVYEDPRMLLSK